MNGESGSESDGVTRRSMDPEQGRGGGSDTRFEIVLSFPVAFVVEVIYREIEIDCVRQPFGNSEVNHVEAAGARENPAGKNGGIVIRVKNIAADVSVAQG